MYETNTHATGVLFLKNKVNVDQGLSGSKKHYKIVLTTFP